MTQLSNVQPDLNRAASFDSRDLAAKLGVADDEDAIVKAAKEYNGSDVYINTFKQMLDRAKGPDTLAVNVDLDFITDPTERQKAADAVGDTIIKAVNTLNEKARAERESEKSESDEDKDEDEDETDDSETKDTNIDYVDADYAKYIIGHMAEELEKELGLLDPDVIKDLIALGIDPKDICDELKSQIAKIFLDQVSNLNQASDDDEPDDGEEKLESHVVPVAVTNVDLVEVKSTRRDAAKRRAQEIALVTEKLRNTGKTKISDVAGFDASAINNDALIDILTKMTANDKLNDKPIIKPVSNSELKALKYKLKQETK